MQITRTTQFTLTALEEHAAVHKEKIQIQKQKNRVHSLEVGAAHEAKSAVRPTHGILAHVRRHRSLQRLQIRAPRWAGVVGRKRHFLRVLDVFVHFGH